MTGGERFCRKTTGGEFRVSRVSQVFSIMEMVLTESYFPGPGGNRRIPRVQIQG